MMTFTQENKYSKITKAVLMVVLGVLLIVTKANAMTMVVQILAGGMCVFGLFSFVMGMKLTGMVPTGSIVNILIAALVFYFAGPVSTVLRYIFGGLLCLFGISQGLKIFSMKSVFGNSLIPFVVPGFATVLGLLFFSEELIGNDILGMIVGILLILYGLSSLLMIYKLNKFMARMNPGNAGKDPIRPSARKKEGWHKVDDQDIKDVDYEKVD